MTRLDPRMTGGSTYGGLVFLLLSSLTNSQFGGSDDCLLDQCTRPVKRNVQDSPTITVSWYTEQLWSVHTRTTH